MSDLDMGARDSAADRVYEQYVATLPLADLWIKRAKEAGFGNPLHAILVGDGIRLVQQLTALARLAALSKEERP